MIAGVYAGQPYNAQGYPVTGASLPSPGIYGYDIYGVDGQLMLRIGDISGMSWGGRSFDLPPGTYGVWGQRAGVWLKGMPQVFYAGASDRTIQVVGQSSGPSGLWTLFVDEAFTFTTIFVPAGRMITWEDFPYFIDVTLVSAPGITSPAIVSWRLDKTLFMATKDKEGTLLAWNFMTGPPADGVTLYSNIRLRRVYKIQTSGTGGAATWTFSVKRIAVLRMFAHEVNEAPILSGAMDAFASGQTTTQTANIGENRDPGGGEGIDRNFEGETGDLSGDVSGGGDSSGPGRIV